MSYRNRDPYEEEEEDDHFEDISADPETMRIRQEKEFYQQRMIDSSMRSLGLVQESQTIASETGGELRKQREQLERTNKNLDKMSGDLNQTDRNITSLKSIWGTMSTWFKKPLQQQQQQNENVSTSADTDKFLALNKGDNEIQENLQKMNKKTDLSWDDGGYNNSRSQGVDAIVDGNLSNLSAGLEILKQQGLALGKEIEDQNDLLGTIQRKVDTNDVRIESQTKKIHKIL